jgi:hypothetical protein
MEAIGISYNQYKELHKRTIRSGEIIGDMINMRICDGMDYPRLM